jgi:hypothetical protein
VIRTFIAAFAVTMLVAISFSPPTWVLTVAFIAVLAFGVSAGLKSGKL